MCEALLTHPATCMCVTDGFSEEPKREREKGKGKQVTVQIKCKIERERQRHFLEFKKKKNPLKMLQKLMIKKYRTIPSP